MTTMPASSGGSKGRKQRSEVSVVFYGSNSWAYTRLGHITDQTPEEMHALLSNGNVTITLSME